MPWCYGNFGLVGFIVEITHYILILGSSITFVKLIFVRIDSISLQSKTTTRFNHVHNNIISDYLLDKKDIPRFKLSH